jgi:alkylhydroperoxidase family enzyme
MPRISIPDAHADDPRGYVYRTYAPKLAAASANFSNTVYGHTSLPYRVVEAARYRTAQINGCRTCQTWRAARDMPPGRPSAFIDNARSIPDESFYQALDDWRVSPMLSERERIAVEFADRMGQSPHSFQDDEAFWTRVHAHFTDEEIVDLTFSIASWIAGGRVLHVLEIDPEVCQIAAPTAA